MALGVRDPGYLPNVLARVEKTRNLLAKTGLDSDLREAIEGILALATTQHELNKRLWEGKKGVPEPHADSHKGGGDSVEGVEIPAPIEAGGSGEIGTPGLGYAPIDHEHPVPTGTPSDLANANAEGASLSLPRLDHQHKRDVRVREDDVDVATRNALNFLNGDVEWTINDDLPNDELEFSAKLSATARLFAQGGTVKSASGASDCIVWEAAYPATIIAVRGVRLNGGTGATINARRNYSSEHLASDLSLPVLGTTYDGGAVQNTAYVAGDILEARIKSASGSPSDISVIIRIRRD